MSKMGKMRSVIFGLVIAAVLSASDCDVPLVDRQLEFAVLNGTNDTIALFIPLDNGESNVAALPEEKRDLHLTDPYAPGEARWLAARINGPNYFEEAPGGLLRIWVFRTEVVRTIPYDSLRSDTNLFELLTFTEEEFEAAGDTIVIR